MTESSTDGYGRWVDTAPPGVAAHDLVPLLLDYLDDVAVRAADRLGSVGGVAVTLGSAGGPLTIGASSALAVDVDLLQYSIGVGPCLQALQSGVGMYVPDLAADHRWADYGPRAAARGAASCISVPVIVHERPAAVFKVYSAEVDGLSTDQRRLADRLAVEIAGGVALAARLAEQAKDLDDRVAAMNTRRAIDLALGMLMERSHCTVEEAFALLRRYSQHFNVKLNDAARQIVESHAGSAAGVDHAPFRSRSGSGPRVRPSGSL